VNPITIYTAFNPADSHLFHSGLEAAGFHPVLDNENSSSWLGGFSTATLISLKVPEVEVADAREFLSS
jgi:NAD(P)H-flavin reductase